MILNRHGASWSWMKLSMHIPQTSSSYVRINFGRADARMPEQFLDDAQIGAILK
jgi:hypothetical protein